MNPASATATAHEAPEEFHPSPVVDPRGVRFGQTLTATGLLAGIAIGRPEPVYLVAVALVTAVATGWRVDVWAALYQTLVAPWVGPTAEGEPAAPHRFAKLLGATGSAIASVLLVAGFDVAGFVVAGAVAAAAGLAAVTGICLGCRLYRGVSLVRRLGLV